MKVPHLNPYYRAAFILVAAAAVLVAIAVITNRRDITTAAVVISALICLLTGIFLATLSKSDPLDLQYVSLLPVQGSINLSRICAELGIQGNATIIPKGKNGSTHTMQFLPVSVYDGAPLPSKTFVSSPDNAGVLFVPSGGPLLREIREREHLVIPQEMAAIKELIREIGVDVLEVAERVFVTEDNEIITVTMEGYRLIGGCKEITRESPRCCTAIPCPVCSLFACLLAEGTGSIVEVERCTVHHENGSVDAVFSLLS
ncbi:MAG: hypothetical protein NTZ39_05680 [Methanoregula sp.]|nr:hypothetical protein [Methanoregula sp.]